MYSSIKSPSMMLTLTLSVYVFSVCCVVAVQQSGDVGTEDGHTMYSTPPETASSRDIQEQTVILKILLIFLYCWAYRTSLNGMQL